ncbi:sulfatase [bacterium]|nr:sulfatase [bacterium]
MDRRDFLRTVSLGALTGSFAGRTALAREASPDAIAARKLNKNDPPPNILFAISDDQSWVHTGANGDRVVNTPAFDRVAREGVLFNHTFCSAPSCTPSRGAILTGRAFSQLEKGGDLWSTLPKKFEVFPDLLQAAGYHIGFTRKGWGPGRIEPGGRTRNPAGQQYRNFEQFLKTVPTGKPFCFWFGSNDPHRSYVKGSGLRSGKKLDDVKVPPFLPDVPEVRSDILDYYFEVERFDREVAEMLKLLEAAGNLDNTIVAITSDNGMPFPRAKANLYDYGTRMPLAVRWPARVKGGRAIRDFISFTDFAPTFLEAAGLKPPPAMSGRSFLDLLVSEKEGRVDPKRDRVFTGRERHAFCRKGGLGYPCRAIRTYRFMYIHNFKPDRWPAGDPKIYGDIDGSPTKTFMMQNRDAGNVTNLFRLAFDKRPPDELYDLKEDPGQLTNVAGLAKYAEAKIKLRADLDNWMKAMGDPRAFGKGGEWDRQPYYGRQNPKFLSPDGKKP